LRRVFARRASWELEASPLAAREAERRRLGLPILDLAASNPTQVGLGGPGEALAAALAAVAREPASRGYEPDARGERSAREAIAACHRAQGAALDPDHVILTAGTSEGYAHLFRLLADPGDRVHLPWPGYGLFEQLAGLEGLETAPYRLLPPQRGARWRVDQPALAASLAPRSRALVVIHPHNPTGALLDPNDRAALRALARERGLALISDEVFAESAAGEARFPSLLCGAEDGPLHFVLSGASKLLGLPQLKLAWIAVGGPPAEREAALARLELIADAYLSVSPLLGRTLALLLPQRAALLAPLRARLAANRAQLAALDPARGVVALPSEAGWAAIVRLPSREGDDAALAELLLARAGVRVQPGSLFDLEPEREVAQLVLSLLTEPALFARGLAALADFAATLA
jgi:aspartate/methionine/tyrosine aminotransferase